MNRRKLARRTALGERIAYKWRPFVIANQIRRAYSDPVYFVEKILGRPLEPWQIRGLQSMIVMARELPSDEEPGSAVITLDELLASRYPPRALKSGPRTTLPKPPATA